MEGINLDLYDIYINIIYKRDFERKYTGYRCWIFDGFILTFPYLSVNQ